MPVWLGSLQEVHGFTSDQLGYIGSLQLVAATLSAFLLSRKIQNVDLSKVIFIATLLIVITNALSLFGSTMLQLLPLRIGSGIGEGLLLASLNGAIARRKDQSTLFAASQTSLAIFGVILFATIPIIISLYNPTGIFAFIAVAGLLSLMFRDLYKEGPASMAVPQATNEQESGKLAQAILPLFALLLIFVACQGSWAFVERMGNARGYSAASISTYLIIGQFVGFISPTIASRFATKGSNILAIILGLAVSIVAIMLVSNQVIPDLYFIGAGLFQFGTLFIVTSYFIWLGKMDETGKLAAAGPSTINAGSAVGPALMGYTIGQSGSYDWIGYLAILLYVVAALMIVAHANKSRPNA